MLLSFGELSGDIDMFGKNYNLKTNYNEYARPIIFSKDTHLKILISEIVKKKC